MTDEALNAETALGQNVTLSDGLGFGKERTNNMRKCSFLLPDPGGEVVRECLDEIERLTTLLVKCREMADYTNAGENIANLIDKFMGPNAKLRCASND